MKRKVTVTYDKYDPYEHCPASEEIGKITTDTAQALLDAIRDATTNNMHRCIANMSVQYDQNLHICNPHAQTLPDEHNTFGISGIMVNGKSWCTKTKWTDPGRASKNCIKNLQRGKCICPVMRKIGEVLYPELYKQKTK